MNIFSGATLICISSDFLLLKKYWFTALLCSLSKPSAQKSATSLIVYFYSWTDIFEINLSYHCRVKTTYVHMYTYLYLGPHRTLRPRAKVWDSICLWQCSKYFCFSTQIIPVGRHFVCVCMMQWMLEIIIEDTAKKKIKDDQGWAFKAVARGRRYISYICTFKYSTINLVIWK